MKKLFFILFCLTLAVYGQEQKRLAILPTEDDGEPQVEPTDLTYLTARLREIAGNVLQGKYGMMTEQSIIDKLGKDNARKACKEAEGCLAQLGRKISADYIGQARLGRFSGNYFTISFVLYNVGSGMEVSTISGNAKDVFGLLTVLDEKAPIAFTKMPGVPSITKATVSSPAIAGGIASVQTNDSDYEFKEKLYRVNLSTEPPGAVLSFDGKPDARKTPYNTELAEGNVRIVATLDKHSKADTTILIKQDNQNINIKLASAQSARRTVVYKFFDGAYRKNGFDYSYGGKISKIEIDKKETFRTAPSLKITLDPNDYSGSSVVLYDEFFDFSKIFLEGAVEFYIKGANGGEQADFSFIDNDGKGKKVNTSLSLNKYVQITKDWQLVKIPLEDFSDRGWYWDDVKKTELPALINWSRISEFRIKTNKGENPQGFKVWIANVEIVRGPR